jgi:carbon-monoxide dehydrogenase medium subunit
MLWQHYFQPSTLDEALRLLHEHAGQARIVAGGTDVLVELQRGVKPTATLIDITNLRELKYVRHEEEVVRLGGLATHNDVIASEACVRGALPLAQACWEVGAPQIRTRATIAGNLITASPANDTIPPLMALGAEVALLSVAGERILPLRDFYTGFRATAIRPDELLREIRFPALRENQRGLFIKLGLRRAQAISVIDLAMVLTFDIAQGPAQSAIITEARIALGCLAPMIVRAATAESFLKGKLLDPATCAEAGRLACDDVAPIDDVRGSARYRLATLAGLVADGLRRIAAGRERDGWPERPVLLEVAEHPNVQTSERSDVAAGITSIQTTINGQPYTLDGDACTKSLLDALRENAGLTGTKEGCAEGECGACTVWLGGQAVMACLTPSGQAHGASVTTIEGLAGTTNDERRTTSGRGLDGASQPSSSVVGPLSPDGLHPLQQAFIANAAVQCGYCIPGMLMAGAKLLEERPSPDIEQVQVALSGNICRCTGYRKIFDAVFAAARSSEF